MVAKKKAKKAVSRTTTKTTQKTPASGRRVEISASIRQLLSPVTSASLEMEATALVGGFTRVTYTLGDLLADASELAGARHDLPDLKERRFPINEHTLKRLALLVAPLTPLAVVRAENVTAAKDRTANADAARLRLLAVRSELADLADVVGLPAEWFKLGTRRSDRINPVVQRLREVLAIARKHQKLLPDPKRVQSLLKEGEMLVEQHTIVRVERSEIKGVSATQVKLADRYTRLLWDVMQHVSAVGLTAYPNDPEREKRYRLDHVYADRPKQKVQPAPAV